MRKLEKIQWRVVPFTNGFIQISTLGDVRRLISQAKLYSIHSLIGEKYEIIPRFMMKVSVGGQSFDVPYCRYQNSERVITRPISVMMYEAFHGIASLSWWEILNVDGNLQNNALNNLILITKEDKCMYLEARKKIYTKYLLPSVDTNGLKCFSNYSNHLCISEYQNDKLVKVHRNLNAVCMSSGMNPHLIRRNLSGLSILHVQHRLFKFGYGPFLVDTSYIQKQIIVAPPSEYTSSSKNNFVFMYSLKGKLIRIFNNLSEAATQIRVSEIQLKLAIQSNAMLDNYIFISEKSSVMSLGSYE